MLFLLLRQSTLYHNHNYFSKCNRLRVSIDVLVFCLCKHSRIFCVVTSGWLPVKQANRRAKILRSQRNRIMVCNVRKHKQQRTENKFLLYTILKNYIKLNMFG